ncbi:sugar transferase [Mycetocola reblochoni]|uniref:Undecaprenyl-phosphate galactosephosphotransferase n=2 Tax=Mycetocola reblochoni TaxID=331618 RepID=A0A1R4I889_9MICO|nr:sugar transferase [Mycetocola reblochoni]RLP68950.1 sugar transferase [Mycetocola reblochoni]SJN16055.1 Undecaprenyl-phosphate galactosephosphotransferase [Mycetocola reblochoni REB411]
MSASTVRATAATASRAEPARSRTAWTRAYRRRVLASDAIAIAGAAVIAYLVRFGSDPTIAIGTTTAKYSTLTAVVAVVWFTALALFGTHRPDVLGKGGQEYTRIINASLAAFGMIAILLILARVDVARSFFLLTLPLGIATLLLSRRLWRGWLRGQRAKNHYLGRAVVVGTAAEADYVSSHIGHDRDADYHVVGSIRTGDGFRPAEVRTRAHDLAADTVIVASSASGDGELLRRLAWELEGTAAELVIASPLSDVAEDRLRFSAVDGLPLIVVQIPRFTGANHVLKRGLDIVGSALGLVLLSPVLLAIAVAVAVTSRGPVLFRQKRIGRGEQPFTMYKFRSMVTTAESDLTALLAENEGAGPLFKLRNDPRVTRVGAVLRRYSLDELPQLWNVLVGDMSLVGPRPPLPREVEDYATDTRRRLLIQPGITGLWQIGGRSDLSWDESVRLDLYYVENWSPVGDLIVIWRTVVMLVKPTGAY